ncbi:serine hydrolase [Lasiosphaeria ovina]|uniref:Serine hydrolase n=1 Tax=Lasiosphaeria ovina TaxID=92902 RepID=A0AAE0N1J2_9PEZI|nr:serine hydrolase [Lasiosphaeria ovina]
MGDDDQTPTAPLQKTAAEAKQPPLASKHQKSNGGGSSTKPSKKEVRILMLHGYTQSGALFRAKTRALEKMLAKALAPLNLVPALLYPTGPNRLSPRDIPGYEPSAAAAADGEDDVMNAWAWFRKDNASGSYRLLDRGMDRLAAVMAEANAPPPATAGEPEVQQQQQQQQQQRGEESDEPVIDGVVGFSQGGSMAAMLAAAMETETMGQGLRPPPPEHAAWVSAVRRANGGRPLKFAVVYSGFYAPPEDLRWLYEPAKIATPTLHFIGSLDTVVDESRSQALVDRCQDPLVVVHPGGHYVPISKEWVMPLVGFIRKCVEGKV